MARRDWSALPLDVLCLLFGDKLCAVDVLMGAGLVCRSWLEAAMAPDVWRFVKMEDHCSGVLGSKTREDRDRALRAMAKAAVDRSDGQLVLFTGKRFVINELLLYIAERSPALKALRLTECVYIADQAFIRATKKAPLVQLQWLEIEESGTITNAALTAIIDSCPSLHTLNVHNCFQIDVHDDDLRAKCASRIESLSITEWDPLDDEFETCPPFLVW